MKGGTDMTKINGIKNLLNGINMHDEAEYIAELLKKENLMETVDYFHRKRNDAKQAMISMNYIGAHDDFLKYRHMYETLAKILENIYLYCDCVA